VAWSAVTQERRDISCAEVTCCFGVPELVPDRIPVNRLMEASVIPRVASSLMTSNSPDHMEEGV
jgi:hypothetical protein